jgi:hypothetical protein
MPVPNPPSFIGRKVLVRKVLVRKVLVGVPQRERLEDKALAIITIETKRGVTPPPDETETEESRFGRSPNDSSDERPAEPAYETPPPDSVKERLKDKVMAITTLDTSTDRSHGAQLA